jgi:hypothetical protein
MFIYVTRADNKNIGQWINRDFIEEIGYLYSKKSPCGEYQLGIRIRGESSFLTEEQYKEIMEQLMQKPSEPLPDVGEPLREIVGSRLMDFMNTKGRTD